MKTVAEIVEMFGSQAEFARAVGVAPSTVSEWRDRDVIPARQQRIVLERAKARGLTVCADDVIPATPMKVS